MSTIMDHAVVAAVIYHVCAAFNVSKDELLSRARPERIAWPRQVAMALAHEASGLNNVELGKVFHRDACTVAWAWICVRDRVQVDKKADKRIRELGDKIQHADIA